MKLKSIKAREELVNPKEVAIFFFKRSQALDLICDAQFINYEYQNVLAVKEEGKCYPICLELLNNRLINNYFSSFGKLSHLLNLDDYSHYTSDDEKHILPVDVLFQIKKVQTVFKEYGGMINEKGEHIINLKSPIIGPHYSVNLLLGNRIGYENVLQTTPKSVVDFLGRGSFRAQAAFQVLATKWDMRPEENGFPANRQFYLIENNKQIFYSLDINDENIKDAKCIHSPNKTTIIYYLKNDLKVERIIFMLPQYKGNPDATEVQVIKVTNLKKEKRTIKIVYTGMFGFTNTDAMKVDILYTSLINQGRIIENEKHEIVALSPDYYPEYAKDGVRFVSLKIDDSYATEFEMDYTNFIGNGTLEKPEHLLNLSNKLIRRGPQFFGLAKEFTLDSNEEKSIDTFTGVVNAKSVKDNQETESLIKELSNLLSLYPTHKEVENEIDKLEKNYDDYKRFLKVETLDKDFNTYVNNNLPFQVYYQTFISRAFAQTQKGYREIGFREIQDLYASMYYFEANNQDELVQELLAAWIKNVYKMGYANHNFYFEGKEPGMCSDDQLWLFQALERYFDLTGNYSFLDKKFLIYNQNEERSVYDTLKAIIQYSSEISIGKHGLPILDSADWNDCLKIDVNWIDGPTKEKIYLNQLKEKNQEYGVPLENDYSESVMNAFLLIIALEAMNKFSNKKEDYEYAKYLENKIIDLRLRVNKYAYKENYFARVLVNKTTKGNYEYVGLFDDRLSNDSLVPGSYYLNSFSWSILSNTANEEQIKKMLDVVDKYLKCEAGFKLCTNHNLLLVGAKEGATEQYFLGDRENGGVFKHATMMAVVAMLKASKEVNDQTLQARLIDDAYFMLDLVYPYKNKENPYLYKGNPRFCTQYINSITRENIGPILSGTSTWLTLAILEMIGLKFMEDGIIILPALKKEETIFKSFFTTQKGRFNVEITKDKDQCCNYQTMKIFLNKKEINSNFIKYQDLSFDSQTILKQMPVTTIPGNHETLIYNEVNGSYQYHEYLGEYRAYSAHFYNPSNGPKFSLNSSYYYKYNDCLFLMLNTQLEYNDLVNLSSWVAETLKNNPSKYSIVMMHKGCYGNYYYGSMDQFNKIFAPVFDEYNVDLVMSGHDHTWARTYSLNNYKVASNENDGTVYWIVGTPGPKFNTPASGASKQFAYSTVEKMTEGCYSYVNVLEEGIYVQGISLSNEIIDEFFIPAKRDSEGNKLTSYETDLKVNVETYGTTTEIDLDVNTLNNVDYLILENVDGSDIKIINRNEIDFTLKNLKINSTYNYQIRIVYQNSSEKVVKFSFNTESYLEINNNELIIKKFMDDVSKYKVYINHTYQQTLYFDEKYQLPSLKEGNYLIKVEQILNGLVLTEDYIYLNGGK